METAVSIDPDAVQAIVAELRAIAATAGRPAGWCPVPTAGATGHAVAAGADVVGAAFASFAGTIGELADAVQQVVAEVLAADAVVAR